MGIEKSIKIFNDLKNEFKINILTDIHNVTDCSIIKDHVDILQIPAFLCRQTDLLVAAAKTGKVINVKKGQFLAPLDMINVAKKIEDSGNKNILLTERGVTFGYNNLISDMRSIEIMKNEIHYPVIFDATHSVQSPGGQGSKSGGDRRFVPVLAKAAVAVGLAGIFMETHNDPDNAPSDGPNMVKLSELRELLEKLIEIDNLVKEN
jgi:2-dehydro-3-deoxyphosphooctonate aldolase (KDO 8-P synthase)